MAWDFETDKDYQVELEWADRFVREKVEPLDYILASPSAVQDPERNRLVRPLQAMVQERGLWACHLGPELGGRGFGQLKLALLNEILGRSTFAPTVFGCQAPDSGNAEILAHYGSDEQKKKYLAPLLRNDVVSCFALTEPQGGADPLLVKSVATETGDGWSLNGQKWFATNASCASFFIVVMETNPQAVSHRRLSAFIVDAEAAGIEILRDVHIAGRREDAAGHGYLQFKDVRVPRDAMLGGRGDAFVVAQTRLGGGRIHHAMRTVGEARKALDMMCERAVSRQTGRGRLADKQLVQAMVAESWIQLEQFRLLVLRTAWLIDKHGDYKAVRKDIAAVKAAMPKVLHDVVTRAIQVHGSLGVSNEMPLVDQLVTSCVLALADGPTEVHQVTLAKELFAATRPTDGLFPTQHRPARRAWAQAQVGRVSLAALRGDAGEPV